MRFIRQRSVPRLRERSALKRGRSLLSRCGESSTRIRLRPVIGQERNVCYTFNKGGTANAHFVL